MPIKIPDGLPAKLALENENIFVMSKERAENQDIRPLRICLVNLMPDKITTETQLLRLLSNSPLQVDIELLQMASHISKNTSSQHLLSFYRKFDDIKKEKFDGLIITGAPIENLEYENVNYWDEICTIMEWSKTNTFSVMHICWGAQAGLYYHYGIPKYPLPQKMFGIFPHEILVPNSSLLHGFDESFFVPHSRHTEIRESDIEACGKLKILAASEMAGVHIVSDMNERNFFITGHSEYDRDTLAKEYFRDMEKGLETAIPYNYFPNDDIYKIPAFTWSCHANLLFSNWLNYVIYQNTPYNLDNLNKNQP